MCTILIFIVQTMHMTSKDFKIYLCSFYLSWFLYYNFHIIFFGDLNLSSMFCHASHHQLFLTFEDSQSILKSWWEKNNLKTSCNFHRNGPLLAHFNSPSFFSWIFVNFFSLVVQSFKICMDVTFCSNDSISVIYKHLFSLRLRKFSYKINLAAILYLVLALVVQNFEPQSKCTKIFGSEILFIMPEMFI